VHLQIENLNMLQQTKFTVGSLDFFTPNFISQIITDYFGFYSLAAAKKIVLSIVIDFASFSYKPLILVIIVLYLNRCSHTMYLGTVH